MKPCNGDKPRPSSSTVNALPKWATHALIACLLYHAGAVLADELEQQLQRNMRVYSHAPSRPGGYGQGIAAEPPPTGTQAQMVLFDRTGRAHAPRRVALGPLPPTTPANAAGGKETLTPDSIRHPRPPKPAYEIDYSINGGYREDRLNWNIAGGQNPPYGYLRPNILSELKWENLHMAQIASNAEITSPGGWHFQGKVNYGWIDGGNNQDSDYQFNNRVAEFSRSNNDASAGHALDASIGAGYRFAFRDENSKPLATAAPLAGYSYSEQYLTMTNGVQTVAKDSPFWCDALFNPACIPPSLGPFPGLNSRYTTQWHGPWLGLRATATPNDWVELFGQFEYHWQNYTGKGNWNLRQEFDHPYSFEHTASGQGLTTRGGLRFGLAPHWALEVGANYTTMRTDPGNDTTYFIDGSQISTRLNRVQWDSWGADAGLRYRY